MGRDWNVVAFRKSRNLAAFGRAAAPAKIQHGVIKGAGREHLAEGDSSGQSFAAADRRSGLGTEFFDLLDVIHLAERILCPEDIVGLQGFADAQGSRRAPEAVQFAHDFHFIADGIADQLKRLQARFQIFCGDPVSLGFAAKGSNGQIFIIL